MTSPREACPHVPTCALFPLFNVKKSLRVWQERYCESAESGFEKCARFQRSKEGKHSPMNLLPNGMMLELAPKR